MAYIGTSPVSGEFKKLDDISSQFNDSNVIFTLQAGGSDVTIGTAQNIIISIDGVIQEPGGAYTVSGSDIQFTEAPNTSSTFFGVLLGSVGQILTLSDDTVSTAKLQNLAVTTAKIDTSAVTEDKIGTGAVTTDKIADANVTTAKLAVTGVTAGDYGNATLIPAFTVGVDGRITSASNVEIVGGATLEDNTTANVSFFPTMAASNTGSFTTAVVTSSKLFFNPSSGELSATDFNSLSDITLKENINTINNPIDLLQNINGIEFTWSDSKKRSAGIIAQEVEKVLPHLVRSNNGLKTVNYSGLIGYLVETVKELNSRIEKLEKK